MQGNKTKKREINFIPKIALERDVRKFTRNSPRDSNPPLTSHDSSCV